MPDYPFEGKKKPPNLGGFLTLASPKLKKWCNRLKQIPQELVVHLVVELYFGCLDNRAQQARAAVGGCLLQVGVASLHIFAEEFGCPIGFAEVVDRRV